MLTLINPIVILPTKYGVRGKGKGIGSPGQGTYPLAHLPLPPPPLLVLGGGAVVCIASWTNHIISNYLQYLFFRNSGLPQHLTLPFTMIAILSPSVSASSMECVVSRMVRPLRYFLSTSHVTLLANGSNPVVGSSKMIICIN